MKRIAYISLAGLLLTGILVVPSRAQTESLGDYARAARKDKDKDKESSSVKKFDNDNLPKDDALSVVGNATEQPSDKAAGNSSDGAQPSTPEKAEEKPASPADQQKAIDEWKQKISAQKAQIDILSRELDVAQREYRLRAAAFYADAGNRLRNEGAWDKEDAQYKQDIAKKQKALDTSKQQLTDMQEQARKAGIPSSARE